MSCPSPYFKQDLDSATLPRSWSCARHCNAWQEAAELEPQGNSSLQMSHGKQGECHETKTGPTKERHASLQNPSPTTYVRMEQANDTPAKAHPPAKQRRRNATKHA
ncbi:unnamed protein product [Effrenium voratum]|uniref:Uncharacterized protein n=1 Tax=Effrenium voratum TaxID=2562239 RepID=A0AA36NDL4_9DINO|nr:unnamed protein product [Effrenium voratum]